MARRTDTRARMLHSAIALMQRNGAAAVTVDAVLADSGAPRGSVYHHFSGGRDQIVSEALRNAGDLMTAMVVNGAQTSPLEAIETFVVFWTDMLVSSDYAHGCPVVAAAVSGAESSPDLQSTVEQIFTDWHVALTESLVAWGVDPARSEPLASMVVASFEGALVLARSRRSLTPLTDVAGELRRIVADALPDTTA
ncbi:TetR/AcrR family transcriptional regulator [Williamsia maris]|uniref:Transcriptional regulator, TetR family n=1 Tax=Williamsia maris TaxID=72806 RepID=A0ABT1H9C5_9NOCA|nr:TetR/AcrR family transcriptional regulator [Williamsia maris]MCP2174863.1 transcriptional regulator, TetR family [Williamsia maris]